MIPASVASPRVIVFCLAWALVLFHLWDVLLPEHGGYFAIQKTTEVKRNAYASGGSNTVVDGPPIQWDNYDTIFLFHTRKAGGSTLRRFLQRVAKKHNVTYKVEEGYVLNEAPEQVFNNHTLYITSLRNPVDRIVSSYWFEGRWPQKVKGENRTDDIAKSLMEWVEFLGTSEKEWYRAQKKNSMWFCASECYSKWFGGWGVKNTTNMTRAIENLQRFDLVLSTERLKDKEYVESLLKRLDAEDLLFSHKNHNLHKFNTTYELTTKDIDYLVSLNQKDLQLVKHVFESRGEDDQTITVPAAH